MPAAREPWLRRISTMRSVGWAFAWEVWSRHRLVGLVGLAYLLVLVVLARVLPGGTLDVPAGDTRSFTAGFGLSMPLGFALLYLIAMFAHGDQMRLEARASGYPRRGFTLPVRTAA